MRVISEERLRKLQAEWTDKCGIKESMIIDHLIDTECKELNQWLPINENTPRNRHLLMYIPEHGQEVMLAREMKNWSPNPTHYQELPGDPV